MIFSLALCFELLTVSGFALHEVLHHLLPLLELGVPRLELGVPRLLPLALALCLLPLLGSLPLGLSLCRRGRLLLGIRIASRQLRRAVAAACRLNAALTLELHLPRKRRVPAYLRLHLLRLRLHLLRLKIARQRLVPCGLAKLRNGRLHVIRSELADRLRRGCLLGRRRSGSAVGPVDGRRGRDKLLEAAPARLAALQERRALRGR